MFHGLHPHVLRHPVYKVQLGADDNDHRRTQGDDLCLHVGARYRFRLDSDIIPFYLKAHATIMCFSCLSAEPTHNLSRHDDWRRLYLQLGQFSRTEYQVLLWSLW